MLAHTKRLTVLPRMQTNKETVSFVTDNESVASYEPLSKPRRKELLFHLPAVERVAAVLVSRSLSSVKGCPCSG